MPEEEDTETKLALLSSMLTDTPQESLLECLIKADGDIERALNINLNSSKRHPLEELRFIDPKRPKRDLSSTKKAQSNGSSDNTLISALKWVETAEAPRKVSTY